MKIVTGKIVAGKVVVEGATFDEGATVTVLAGDGEADFELTPAQEAELLLAIEQAERGSLIPADELLSSLLHKP